MHFTISLSQSIFFRRTSSVKARNTSYCNNFWENSFPNKKQWLLMYTDDYPSYHMETLQIQKMCFLYGLKQYTLIYAPFGHLWPRKYGQGYLFVLKTMNRLHIYVKQRSRYVSMFYSILYAFESLVTEKVRATICTLKTTNRLTQDEEIRQCLL